jgi:hypothetical protein
MSGAFPLEEFHILGPIGRGEFGKVHRATWMTGRVDVALKHIESGQGPAKLEAERHGVRLQELVWQQHPDIVPRIYCDGLSANGDYYIAMEFVRGESLHDILRRTRLSQDKAVGLTRILTTILQRLHAFHPPILHSDLKPEHVLVLDDGSVRIIDFGIARRPEAGAATHNAFLSVMYAAPERVDDEARNVHPSDDLWALGIMFFEMLAGRHPREVYRAQIEDAVRRDDLVTVATLLRERPGTLPDGSSPQLDAIVRKMLAPQPGHRYATAEQVLADLERYADGAETVAYQQLVAAGRATRVVTRSRPVPAGAPTMPVPPPLPLSDRGAGRVSPADTANAGLTRPAPQVVSARPAPQVASATPASNRGAGLVRPARIRRLLTRRTVGVVLRAIAALLVARFIIGEGTVWSRAERFRGRIASFDTGDLPSIPPMVRSLRNGALFGFAAKRIDRPLAARMLELAEPTIADYRSDTPSAKQPQWKAASAALAIATEARPNDSHIRARSKYIEGHLLRIDAQGRPVDQARPMLDRSVAAFREAARLDTQWPDPFLGLAAVHAYGLRDVNSVAQDVSEAARRGFTGGRREHAEVADAFSYRADQARANAAHETGDERVRLLTAAASDYQGCVDHYAGVTGYFNSDKNLERCRRMFETVSRDLEIAPVSGQP